MKRTFKEFKHAINAMLEREIGLSSDDLPDFCYRANYDSGVSARETAYEALDNAGGTV